MKTATQPFQFVTASYLTRIDNQKAINLSELSEGLEHASDESIFYHTYQSLGRFHFLTEGLSNDFAQWTLASLNSNTLAEKLAGIDVRDYTSLAELRGDLRRIVSDYCAVNPRETSQSGFEPFYFCEAIAVTAPLPFEAGTLGEFRDGLAHVSHDTFHHHFIASRLRLQLGENDFSHWLVHDLDEPGLARQINRIDIYTNTIDSARQDVIELVEARL